MEFSDIKIKTDDTWKVKLFKLFITLAVATFAWYIKIKTS